MITLRPAAGAMLTGPNAVWAVAPRGLSPGTNPVMSNATNATIVEARAHLIDDPDLFNLVPSISSLYLGPSIWSLYLAWFAQSSP